MVDGPLLGAPQNTPTQRFPSRAMFPVFDSTELAYRVSAAGQGTITILGRGLEEIVAVEVGRDVKVGGNSGAAPTVGTLTVTDTSITVPLDATASTQDDIWGVILRDGEGRPFACPSPLLIQPGE